MERYNKFVLEAEEGIFFVIEKGKANELVIKACKEEQEEQKLIKQEEVKETKEFKANIVIGEKLEESIDDNKEENVKEEIKVAREEEKKESSMLESLPKNVPKEEIKEEVEEKTVILDDKVENKKEEEEEIKEYSENYNNPPIPIGFEHIEGNWNDGFVIQRSQDKSQFVWIPIGILEANGTFDGKVYDQKFGRRNYRKDDFSDEKYHESLEGELLKQFNAVKKYGGFYISRFNVSKNAEGKIVSVKDAMPLVNISYDNAFKMAEQMVKQDDVKSHLPFGAEYDSVLEWFINSKQKKLNEVAGISNEWGNFFNSRNSSKSLAKTGSNEEWCVLRIYDFAGNVRELTQEKFEKDYGVMRGGGFNNVSSSVAIRQRNFHTLYYRDTGFRVVLYLQ